MDNNKIKRFKRIVYGLIGLFALFFITGFLDLGGKTLLVIILLYFVLGIILNICIFRSKPEGKPRASLLLTGVAVAVFSMGVTYGILGIWGLYPINDIVYLTSVIASWSGFLFGAIWSILELRKRGGHDASSPPQ